MSRSEFEKKGSWTKTIIIAGICGAVLAYVLTMLGYADHYILEGFLTGFVGGIIKITIMVILAAITTKGVVHGIRKINGDNIIPAKFSTLKGGVMGGILGVALGFGLAQYVFGYDMVMLIVMFVSVGLFVGCFGNSLKNRGIFFALAVGFFIPFDIKYSSIFFDLYRIELHPDLESVFRYSSRLSDEAFLTLLTISVIFALFVYILTHEKVFHLYPSFFSALMTLSIFLTIQLVLVYSNFLYFYVFLNQYFLILIIAFGISLFVSWFLVKRADNYNVWR